MSQDFFWTARLFEKDKLKASRYFKTEEERNLFVSAHPEWKKRGKICAAHLKKHIESEPEASFSSEEEK